MQQTWRRIIVGLSAATALMVSVWAIAAGNGAPARAIPYAGQLDVDGAPFTGLVRLTFRIWDDPVAGTLLVSQTMSDVPVYGGRFAVVINAAIPDTVYNAGTPYVAVEVGACTAPGACATPTPLVGRQQLFPVAQATRAEQAFNFTVQQQLTVQGGATINGLVLGNVIGDTGYRGVAAPGQDSLGSYGFVQSTNGMYTLLNARQGGSVHLRTGNADRVVVTDSGAAVTGTLNVTGTLTAPGYQSSCLPGEVNLTLPTCCRINQRTGETRCREASNWTSSVWGAERDSPFAASTPGHYSLSCFSGRSGYSHPTCCRTDVAGNVTCREAAAWNLSSWNTATGQAF